MAKTTILLTLCLHVAWFDQVLSAPKATIRPAAKGKGHTYNISNIAWDPDGKRIAGSSGDKIMRKEGTASSVFDLYKQVRGNVIVMDVATGKVLHTLKGHTELVQDVAWSPDGTKLASGSHDKTVKVWDWASGRELQTLTGHKNWVSSVAWSPDGTKLASGSHDKTLKVWDWANGKESQTCRGHLDYIMSVAWSSDGTRLVSGGYDKNIRIWHPSSGELLQTLKGHTDHVMSVDWSPDGTRLASCSDDKTIRIWDWADGKELQTINGHEQFVMSVAWDPAGKRLASSGWDNTVKIWDVSSSRELYALEGHATNVWSAAWSPDGERLASGDRDGIINIWTLKPTIVFRSIGNVTRSAKWLQISSGSNHELAIKTDGSLWAWGGNAAGQLGLGFRHKSPDGPTPVTDETAWIKAAAGYGVGAISHSIALKQDGTLWAWGYDLFGADGSITSPQQIGTDSGWSDLSAGANHNLALKKDGSLWAWGSNNKGQLGDGSKIDRNLPLKIVSDTKWQALAAGGDNSLAIKPDGSLWIWGSNLDDQFGSDTREKKKNTPTRVGSDNDWAEACIGPSNGSLGYILARRKDGSLWAWGNRFRGNSFKSKGRIIFFSSPRPIQIGRDKDWAAISAGSSHSLAIKEDGSLWRWDLKIDERLDSGATAKKQSTPRKIHDGPWAIPMAGEDTSFAIRKDGTLWQINGRSLSEIK